MAPNPVVGPGPVNVYFRLLSTSRDVRLVVMTTANRKVIDVIKHGPFVPRDQSVKLDLIDDWGNPLANGLFYFYVMADGSTRMTGKFVVMR